MKPRTLIPTCLLAAGLPLSAASISVNFGADRSGSAVDEAGKTAGAIPVAGNLWNNTTVNGGGFLDNLVDDSGTITTAFIDWTARNTWQSASSGATATSENGDLTKGYLDDGDDWSVILESPYLLNDIYIIHATDQGSPATISAVSVNGTFYKGDEAGGTTLASGSGDSWSAQNWTNADTLTESDNFLKVTAQPGVVLSALNASPGRAAIAGVQVADAYTGTLSYWDLDGETPGAGSSAGNASGNWADANWSTSATGETATAAWTSGNAAVFSAGTDATGLSTVTLAGTETADAVWVQQGKVTLAGGTLELGGTGLLRGDDPNFFGDGLVVDSAITGTDVTTVGTVTLNNNANAITGTVTVLGETVLGADNTWGQLGGSGTLDLQGNVLTAGDDSDSNFGGEILGNVGSGLVKTGTGTLTVGDVLGQLDTVTISDGTLALTGGGSTFWTLSGGGNLIKTGGGTLVMESTANTGFSGKSTVAGGILRIPAQETLGATPAEVVSDSITLGGGGRIQGGSADGADLLLDANRGITLNGGNSGFYTWTGFTTTVNGDISGDGSLASHDGGNLIINGDVDITGSLHTNSGQTSNTTYNSSSLVAGDGLNLRAGTTTLNVGTATLQDIELGNAGGQSHQLTQLAGDINVTDDIRIGHWGNETSVYTMQGGSLTQPDTVTNPTSEGQANLFLGIDGTGEFHLEGGTLTTTSLVIDGRGNTDGNDIFAMTGGTLNMGKWGIRSGNNGGTYLFQLGGGTVAATANWSSNLNVELTGTNGDVTFAPDGHTIELSGLLSGAGGLVKDGSGTLALTGTVLGTYAGTTQVNGGTLQVGGLATGTSPVTVATGGSIMAGTPAAPGTGTVEALNLVDGSTSVFRVGGDTNDRLEVFQTNGLSVTGAHTIDLLPVGDLAVGDQAPLIDYDGTIGGDGFAGFQLATLPNPHYVVSLVDNTLDTSVDVKLDDIMPISWAGPGTTWDLNNSANWSTGSASNFYPSDLANFGDLDPEESVVVDTSLGAIEPAAMIFTNTTATTYTMSGDAISGPTGLAKTGDGTVILTNDNTFTGGVDVQAGTLQLGDGGTSGSVAGDINLAFDSVLAVDRSDAFTMTAIGGQTITGDGAMEFNGTGELTLAGRNTFTGGLTVNSGTVILTGGGWYQSPSAGTGMLTVNDEAVVVNWNAHAFGASYDPNTDLTLNEGGVFQVRNATYMRDIWMTGATIENHPGSNSQVQTRGNGGTDLVVEDSAIQSVITSGYAAIGGSTITVNDPDTNFLISGRLHGGAQITKDGVGVLEVSNNGDFTGTWNITEGSVLVNTAGHSVVNNNLTGTALLEHGGPGSLILGGDGSGFAGIIDANGKTVNLLGGTSGSGTDGTLALEGGMLTLGYNQTEGLLLYGTFQGGALDTTPLDTTTARASASALQGGIGGNTTIAFDGEIYLTAGDWSFAENVDDAAYVAIDGTVILDNATWDVPTSGTFTAAADGWYPITLRVQNGGGGNGPSGGWPFSIGMKTGAPSTNPADLTAFEIGALGTRCRVTSVAGTVNMAGGLTLSGDTANTVDTRDGILTIGGPVAGGTPDELIKTGTGMLALDGTNTLTGPVNVQQGTLSVGGVLDTADSLTVNIGASLQGTGSVGAATVNGNLRPGTSVGTLTTGDLNLGPAASYHAEIDSDLGTTDNVVVNGNVTIDPNTQIIFSDLGASTVPGGTKLVIMEYTGTLTGTFAGRADGSTVFIGVNEFILNYDDTSGVNSAVTLSTSGSDDYGDWIAGYASLTGPDADPTADPDGDGLINGAEYAFGLDPTSPASVNAINVPLDKASGTFTYTRRALGLTGWSYAIETSTDLVETSWEIDAGATENVLGTVDGVETVEITLTGPLGDAVYVRVVGTAP